MERAALNELKASVPLSDVIGKHVKLGRANAGGFRAGSCLCAPARGKSPLWVNERSGTFGCWKGGCGGDVFEFLRRFEGKDFKTALAFLGGRDVPRAEAANLAHTRARGDAEAAARGAARAEAERKRAFEIWRHGVPLAGTAAEAYFRHRGLDPPASNALRFSAAEAYWHAGPGEPEIVRRGPCLLAAIQAPDGKFLGLHRTWLDPRLGAAALPRGASGKAVITAADGTPLPAKKMRGAKQGGAVRLHNCLPGAGDRVFLAGEGIETVATAYQALVKCGGRQNAYAAWAACDLGNLAGGTRGPSAPHPKNPRLQVPSSEPDLNSPGMMPPAGTSRAILLGDGDSDPHVTAALLERARRRWGAAGVRACIAMAPDGADFNDLARAG